MIRRNSALFALVFSTLALERRPCFQCAAIDRALPSGVRGPVLLPPCNLQRVRPRMAGFWQGVPLRVLARHRLPGQWGPKRVALLDSIRATGYFVVTMPLRRSQGWTIARFSGDLSAGLNPVPGSLHHGPRPIAQGLQDKPHQQRFGHSPGAL